MADPTPAGGGDLGRLVAEINALKKRVFGLESPSGTQRNLTVRRLAETVDALPIQATSIDRQTGISATSTGFVTKASVTVTVPEGKTVAAVLGIGAARITDTTSGGLTSSNARVVIAGNSGGSFPAAKDAAVSQVINVLNATHALTFDVIPESTFTVAVQVSALNASAFPASGANFAQIAAIATFTSPPEPGI